MTQLHPAIRGERGNGYCGPAALACVIGCTIDEAAFTPRTVSGKRSIHGVAPAHMIEALEGIFGAAVEQMADRGPLERVAPELNPGLYIVVFNDHYIALDAARQEMCDNHTIYPLPVMRYRKRRKRIVQLWRVTPAQEVA